MVYEKQDRECTLQRKVGLDQYFTRLEDAKRFIDKVDGLFDLSTFDIVLEPSAGSGSFYNQLPNNRVGLDLEPLCDGVIQTDFFDWDWPAFTRICTIGNPPFGRRGSMAKQFIERATVFSDVVAFVLPAIFAKPTFTNTLNPLFHKVHEEFVDEFVLPNGDTKKIKCVFQIWQKKSVPRKKVIKTKKHPDFTITHRHISRIEASELKELEMEYDFAMGQITGKVAEIKGLTKGSQFFIKDLTNDGSVRAIFENMDFSYLDKYAMGVTSLSVGDVIEEYKRVHQCQR